jgi:TolB-like protein/Flp pilus assembly protein TadD
MSIPDKAVFLSYASQDAAAARRICEALRAAGIAVWFDQSELRGGDAWDASIRRQIKECALFVPLISANSEARKEGYFRREWNIAVDRTRDMADEEAFLVPVVIEATMIVAARVPEKFRHVQWTHLPGGETPEAFVDRIRGLLADGGSRGSMPAPSSPNQTRARRPAEVTPAAKSFGAVPKTMVLVAGLVLAAAAALYLILHRASNPQKPAIDTAATVRSPALSDSAPPVAFTPPPHSLAVLPFVNMSGDPQQDYFSDGLSEELLNSLAAIRDLQVAARTSSFHFKGSDVDLSEVAHKLNVGAVLEGSVRKDGNHVRITAELINAITGYHLWSQRYDRDLKNILALQTEIATAVTKALQATMLADAAAAIEVGGSEDPRAFDAYLRGEKLAGHIDKESVLARIAAYEESLRADPRFAKAMVGKASAVEDFAGYHAASSDRQKYADEALALVRQAVAVAPDLGTAHMVLARNLFFSRFDFKDTLTEVDRALALSPGDVYVLRSSVALLNDLGRPDAALVNARHAVVLDPLNGLSYRTLGEAMLNKRQYRDALDAYDRAYALDPRTGLLGLEKAYTDRALGDLDGAAKACPTETVEFFMHQCLAIVYHKLGRISEAEHELAVAQKLNGDSGAYQYAEIYAQWGDIPTALTWLESAYRLRDGGLAILRIDLDIDPLRQEPRFQALEHKLDFPP